MKKYILSFQDWVCDLEEEFQWAKVTDMLYMHWKMNPLSMEKLLHAGTELWYALLECNYYKSAPKAPENFEFIDRDLTMNRLIEITKFGELHFGDNPIFNAYFGVMIDVQPFFFFTSEDNCEEWFEKGEKMIEYAYTQDSESLFVQGLYCQLTHSKGKEPFEEVCKKIWSVVTPKQWGESGVNRYFFYYLSGELFYPNEYQ